MKRLLISGLLLLSLTMAAATKFPYQDASLHPAVRAQDLLSRMTLEEKVGQLVCLMGWDSYVRSGNKLRTEAQERKDGPAAVPWRRGNSRPRGLWVLRGPKCPQQNARFEGLE